MKPSTDTDIIKMIFLIVVPSEVQVRVSTGQAHGSPDPSAPFLFSRPSRPHLVKGRAYKPRRALEIKLCTQ